MAVEDAAHYTAILEIVKVTPAEERPVNQRGFPTSSDKELKGKHSKEVVKLVVRASTLEKLAEKLKGHIDLVEE